MRTENIQTAFKNKANYVQRVLSTNITDLDRLAGSASMDALPANRT